MVSLLNCNSYYITQRTETFVSIMRCQKRWSNCDNQLNLINFHRVPIIPRQNKGQKMNKNVKFWHSLKVKPGFLILLINLKTGATQWRAGVGRQRGTKVREAGERGTGNGRLWPPVPPPPPQKCAPVKNFLVRCEGCSLVGCVLLRGCVNTAQILHVFLQPGWSEKYFVGLAEATATIGIKSNVFHCLYCATNSLRNSTDA